MSRRHAATALCVAACAALLLGGATPPIIPLLALFFLVGVKAPFLDHRRIAVPETVLGIANVAFWVLFAWATILHGVPWPPLQTSLAFGTLFLLLRSLSPFSLYNEFLVLLASLYLLLGSVDAARGWLPLLMTGIYLLVACLSLPVRARRVPKEQEETRLRLLRPAGAWSLLPAFLGLLLAVGGFLAGTLLYFVVPRWSEGGELSDHAEALAAARSERIDRLGAGEGAGGTTGFPKTVSLGHIGRIKRDERIAFVAELRKEGRPYDPSSQEQTMLLLRARAWLDYDPAEGSWKLPRTQRRALPPPGLLEEGPTLLDWNLSLRTDEAHLLFLPQRARRVRAPRDVLLVDDLGIVTTREEIRQYGVEAAAPFCDDTAMARLEPLRGDARLLAVPEGLRTELQERLSRASPATILEAVQIVRRFFREGRFRYTLSLPVAIAEAEDPLLGFLDSREGHCELYAAAGCLFLRTLGVPARLAGGLRLSERIGPGLYQARYSNAHAWVEIASREAGFVAVDFTPPDREAASPAEGPLTASGASVQGSAKGGPLGRASLGVDWRRPFSYGRIEQRAFVRHLSGLLGRLPWLALSGAALLLLALPLLLRLAFRRGPPDPLRVMAPTGVARRTLAFYVRWLRACAKRGHRRLLNQTPREFLGTLPLELRSQGEAITLEFERRRYGG